MKNIRWTSDRLRACFAGADWTSSNVRVARALGMMPEATAQLRRRLRDNGFDVPRAAWPVRRVEAADLVRAGLGAKPDTELALAFGVSRERVRQIRVGLGIPLNREASLRRIVEATRRRGERRRRPFIPRLRRAARRGESLSDIARRFGVHPSTVRRMADAHGIAVRGPRRMEEWAAEIDWTLRNVEIAKRHGTHVVYVARLRKILRDRGFRIPPWTRKARR